MLLVPSPLLLSPRPAQRRQKPELGLFDLGAVRPDLKPIGKRNNVVLEGGGVGVLHDQHETDAARRCASRILSALRQCHARTHSWEDACVRAHTSDVTSDGLHTHSHRKTSTCTGAVPSRCTHV